MTYVATLKSKELVVHVKYSEATTTFEEAFDILVIENNFNCWAYFAKKLVQTKRC